MKAPYLLLAVLASLALLLGPCQATENLEVVGKLEVLIADNFLDGSLQYKVIFEEEATSKRLHLNPSSFGDALPTLRNDMKAKIWLENLVSSNAKRGSEDSESIETDISSSENDLLDVARFELVRKTNFFPNSSFLPSFSVSKALILTLNPCSPL